ncbi:MAG: hypothetical protein ACYC6L_10540 [Anaerolineae bacterium]
MFPFFMGPRRGFHMHFGCLGALLRLVLVALGIKYLVDHTRNQQSTQLWPPTTGQWNQPPAPQQPAPGETKPLEQDKVDPWVDKVQ